MPVLVDEPQMSVANFMALWLAIHGGDPVPDSIAVLRAGAAVMQVLRDDASSNKELSGQVVAAMQKSLASLE